MEQHPLSTALSPLLPISPSFIYLHHPYHSSGYALPAGFGDEEVTREHAESEEEGTSGIDEELEAQMRTLTIKVDLGALVGPVDQGSPTLSNASVGSGTTLSQKSFYNAIIRTTFSVITRKIGLLKARHRDSDAAASSTPQVGKRKSTRGVVDPFFAAVQTFEDTFRSLVGKDVYRWDVFLTRLRLMLDAFKHIIAVGLGQKKENGEGEFGLTLVILESQMLQKYLGITWHALLRLNEMVRCSFLQADERNHSLKPGCRWLCVQRPSSSALFGPGMISSLRVVTHRNHITCFFKHPTKIVSQAILVCFPSPDGPYFQRYCGHCRNAIHTRCSPISWTWSIPPAAISYQ